MKGIDNKGFTLVEVLAVVIIIAVLGIIAIPSVIDTIGTGKESAYQILIKNVKTGSQQLFEEVSYGGVTLYHYDNTGKTDAGIFIGNANRADEQKITRDQITVNLQTLVSNGFLTGTNNGNTGSGSSNTNSKIITNPKTGSDIGACEIVIERIVNQNENSKTTYEITSKSTDTNCPTTDDYK